MTLSPMRSLSDSRRRANIRKIYLYANLLYSPSWKEKFDYNSPFRKEK